MVQIVVVVIFCILMIKKLFEAEETLRVMMVMILKSQTELE